MEDILYYIGLGLVVIVSLARKGGKKRARRAPKRVDMPESAPIPTGFPQFEMLFDEPEREEAAQPTPVKYSYKEAESLETIIDEVEEYNLSANQTPAAEKSASGRIEGLASKPKNTDATAPKAKKTLQNGENSGISEEFDIQKAVIYSEILKPKFEE